MTNSDPNVIGRFYLEHLFNTEVMASIIRVDKGTETGVMATMHAYLRQQHEDDMDPAETVVYGPSTSNQVRHINISRTKISLYTSFLVGLVGWKITICCFLHYVATVHMPQAMAAMLSRL